MSSTRSPLGLLLATAKRVGEEFCWPAPSALEVVEALRGLGYAVLGVELWAFDEPEGPPRVVGWSTYATETALEWGDLVAVSAQSAAEAITGHEGDLVLWVNLTFASEEQMRAEED